jgi:hypothetical protein
VDLVIDLRERLAPYVDADDATPDGTAPDDLWSEPLLAGPSRRLRPPRVAYQPRHLAT